MAFGDLTTLADVTAWLQTGKTPFPSAGAALLARRVPAAGRFIESWLDRQLAVSDWIEVRDGSGGQRLAFANFPVSAVLALSVDGLVLPPAPPNGGFGGG